MEIIQILLPNYCLKIRHQRGNEFTIAALGIDEKDPVVEVLVRRGRPVAGRFVLLEVVAPLQVVGVHLVLGDELVLVPVREEPAVLAAHQPSVVGVHVTCLIVWVLGCFSGCRFRKESRLDSWVEKCLHTLFDSVECENYSICSIYFV